MLNFESSPTPDIQNCDSVTIKLEALHTMDSSDTIDTADPASMSLKGVVDDMMALKSGMLEPMPSDSFVHANSHGSSSDSGQSSYGKSSWADENMNAALEVLSGNAT